MLLPDYLLAFVAAATVLVVTPGLDTALILRTAAAEGPLKAVMTGLGIALGCLAWGAIVSIGLGALLTASTIAYEVLRWAGAAYLLYLGVRLLRAPHRRFALDGSIRSCTTRVQWLARGFLTNILNPKMGVFYVSFLPQFIPAGANVSLTIMLLTLIHMALGTMWFGILILATQPIAHVLRKTKVVMWLDRLTGGILIAFGVRLAATAHR